MSEHISEKTLKALEKERAMNKDLNPYGLEQRDRLAAELSQAKNLKDLRNVMRLLKHLYEGLKY